MATHTLVQSTLVQTNNQPLSINPQAVAANSVTVSQFVKTYRSAEKRAIVSAGGLAFSAQDRLTLNAMRVALNYDFTQAATAVSENPADFARHWQRFQHWANQIKKGLIRVAPEADYIADRTHKNARVTKKSKKEAAQQQQPRSNTAPVSQPQAPVAAAGQQSAQQTTLHQLGMVFGSREEAEAHLQEVMYGLVRLGMDDMDALVPAMQAKLIKAKQDMVLEAKAQAIVTALERGGIATNEAGKILELAMSLMPA